MLLNNIPQSPNHSYIPSLSQTLLQFPINPMQYTNCTLASPHVHAPINKTSLITNQI